MKIFQIVLFCLCSITAYTQTDKRISTTHESVGVDTYSFSKAVITIYDDNSKTVLFTQTFQDTTSLQEIKDIPFPRQPIFLSAQIHAGQLVACTLWNNLKEYIISDDRTLLLPSKKSDTYETENEDDSFSQGFYLSPKDTLELEGNTSTITFSDTYGNSQYDHSLYGVLTIVLVKDEPYTDRLL